jgi:phenylacetate-CoA ligase
MKKIIRNTVTRLKGNSINKEYLEIKKIKNKNDLQTFQETYLKKLLLHSYQSVPYYHDIFDRIGIITNNTVDLTKFNKIPILTKELLRKHQKELMSNDKDTRKSFQNFSGGSTGEPTMFLQDHTYYIWFMATNQYYYQDMLGIDEKNVRKVLLWGNPQDLFEGSEGVINKIKNWFTNKIFLNSFRMTEKDLSFYIKTINAYQPKFIRGYAGSLYELAKYSEKNNLPLHSPQVLVSSAETLTNEMRTKIEAVFKTKLYDFYGSRETASIAGECKEGHIHVFSFNNILEILDQNNQPVTETEEGRIIVTNLHNYSMPFIRYEIGDAAIPGIQTCSCKNFLPCLQKVCGRLEEQFIKKDGSIVIGYFFVHLIGVLLNKGYIKKFRVLQEDYEKIRIIAILDKGLPESEKQQIEQKIRVEMGTDCTILWEFVDTIPNTKSGKYLYTQSYVTR